jgi:hypothetical protein
MIQNSDGQSVTRYGKNVLVGLFLIVALVTVPVVIDHIAHINILMEPRTYAEEIVPVRQADGSMLACTQFNPETQARQLGECRAVAAFGIEIAEMGKMGMALFMLVVGIAAFVGICWSGIKGFFS